LPQPALAQPAVVAETPAPLPPALPTEKHVEPAQS